MKKYLTIILALSLSPSLLHADEQLSLKTQKDKASYSIGLEMGSAMKQQKLEVDPDLIVAGFRAGLSGTKSLLSEAESKQVMEIFEKEMEARMAKETKELPEKNKKEGESFLAENKKKTGVTTLDSGLQYRIVREGTGVLPKATDTVTAHYRGTLLDGTEFDSSYSRNEPSKFGVDQVIKGWKEALQLMKVGSKWQLFVPSNLAYEDQGAGRVIGPNATLIFDVELISIDKP